jgi:pyridoxamine 5'-phosphate oxidase
MALATVDPNGRPSVRMVVCRGFDVRAGWLAFYSDRPSRKGVALAAHPRAAVVFHWEALERQVRIEGPVTQAPDDMTDAYWKSRPLDARIAAVASDQSEPIENRAALLAKVDATAVRYGDAPPRPERWIGYLVWAEQVELWVSQPARVHDRAVWTRALTAAGAGFTGGPWRATRLQP